MELYTKRSLSQVGTLSTQLSGSLAVRKSVPRYSFLIMSSVFVLNVIFCLSLMLKTGRKFK